LFKLKSIEFSSYDIKRGIKLPEISENLSEFFGIMFGDGTILDKGRIHRFGISLNLTEDFIYKNYVTNLITELFGVEPRVRKRRKEGKFDIEINSKAISRFLLYLGFPKGKKINKLTTPPWIFNSKKYLRVFLRGLVDTDGSLFFAKRGTYKLNSYPVIEIKICDKKFIGQLSSTIKYLGFECNKNDIKVQLNGKQNLEKWQKEIGFKNFNHQSRYLIWEKFKYCIPNTSLKQRMKILKLRWQKGNACNPAMRITGMSRIACRARDCETTRNSGFKSPPQLSFVRCKK